MNITRRKVTSHDAAFLLDLFKAVRGPDFARLPPALFENVLGLQFQVQTAGYASQYPNSDHEIILLDGADAGRIMVWRTPSQFVLVDISLLPAHQNRGIGTLLVNELIAEARAAGLPLRCSVGLSNPGSLRFHQRLGFRIVARDQVYCELECAP